MVTSRFSGFLILFLTVLAFTRPAGAAGLERRTWMVDGVAREALVSLPADTSATGAPVVFAFHGHGGTMRQAAASFPIHQLWPDAIVIYPQGLPTAGQLTDPEGRKSGWQAGAGSEGDRDLKFFDAMRASLQKQYRTDRRRVYATGHSNGGGFTYLLWAERGEVLAAVAPSAAILVRGARDLSPMPVLHVGSPKDPLVKFAWQARMIDQVLRVNGCGKRDPGATGYTVYPSTKGAEVATYLHDQGHTYPSAATELIVKFFQAHVGR